MLKKKLLKEVQELRKENEKLKIELENIKDLTKEIEELKEELHDKFQDIRMLIYEICLYQGFDNLGAFQPKKLFDYLKNKEHFFKLLKIEKPDKNTSLLEIRNTLLIEREYVYHICNNLDDLRDIFEVLAPFELNNENPPIFIDVGALPYSTLLSLFKIKWIGFNKDRETLEEIENYVKDFVKPLSKVLEIDNFEDYIDIRGEYTENIQEDCNYSLLKLTIHHLGEISNYEINSKTKKPLYNFDKMMKIVENLSNHTKKRLAIGDRIQNEISVEDFIIKDRDTGQPANFLKHSEFFLLFKMLKERFEIRYKNSKDKLLCQALVNPKRAFKIGFNHDHFLWIYGIKK